MSSSPDSTERRNKDSQEKESGSATLTRLYREAAPYLALGVQLAATVVIMFYVGYWADDHFGTKPWFMIVGLMLGVTAGFYNFFKTVSELGKKVDASVHREEHPGKK